MGRLNHMPSLGRLISLISLNALVLVIVLVTAIPYVYMVSATFKPNTEVYSLPITLLPRSFYTGNYEQLFSMFPYVRWFVNTVFVASLRTGIAIVLCAMGGYAFAKYEFRFKRALFLLLLATMMLPFHVVLIPLFIMMVRIQWVNTYYALIVPFAVSAYGIFLLRQYMVSVPGELLDAARIDGSSEMGIFWRIAMPLVKPGLGVVAILFFTMAWNDFIWPLIVLSKTALYTLPLGIATMFGPYEIQYGTIMAGSFLSTVPIVIVFLAMQRQFVSGLTVGALKG